MKSIFYIAVIFFVLFEIINVYFVMPLPGSQQIDSIDFAYFIYSWRWTFRLLLSILLLVGLFKSQWKRKWIPIIPLTILAVVIYVINFIMTADAIFTQPEKLQLANAQNNKVDSNRLVIGVVDNGIAKAYPLQYLGYHHFIYDTLNSKPILVTYCTVCRTGRVYDPTVNGKVEKFRLVGMDHFNAMIEDESTKSWWRQSTGEAIAGKLKGTKLIELHCSQVSLSQWLKLYPNSLVMQADSLSVNSYDTSFNYESGKSKRSLTGTNNQSWKEKSWVIGVKINQKSRVFDWNELLRKRILHSNIDDTKFFVVLCKDNKSFFAYKNNFADMPTIVDDTIFLQSKRYKMNGVGINTSSHLIPLTAYQEFWHSWKTFQPNTLK
jgi:hypothetical protein